jgi:CRISPR-associated protein Cst2
MGKVVQISIIGKISGNVNADEVIGTRITLKKMYSSSGEVLPFVSARAIKYAIRQALKERGYEVDPLIVNPQAGESLRLSDSANPLKYVDNDLFGYMYTIGGGGGEGGSLKRQAPIAISYFKALKDTPIKTDFAAKFTRPWSVGEEPPAPFEIEVAEFIGKVNCIMYDYIGDFTPDKKIAQRLKGRNPKVNEILQLPDKLNEKERKERIRAFAEIFLSPAYVLPRRTNSLNIPEYFAALIVLSEKGPLPVFSYLDWDFEKGKVKSEKLKRMVGREEIVKNSKEILLIDYENVIEEVPQNMKVVSVKEAVDKIVNFL